MMAFRGAWTLTVGEAGAGVGVTGPKPQSESRVLALPDPCLRVWLLKEAATEPPDWMWLP